MKYKPFMDALIRAKARGISVRVFVDERLMTDNRLGYLEAKGIIQSYNIFDSE